MLFSFLPLLCADLNDFTVFLQYFITLMGIIENYIQIHYGNDSLGLNVVNYHENVTMQIIMFLKSDRFHISFDLVVDCELYVFYEMNLYVFKEVHAGLIWV